MYRKILVPVDLAHPETAEHTVSVAKAIAETGNVELTLLNVVPELPGYVAAELPSSITLNIKTSADRDLRKLAKDLGLEGTCQILLRSGRPHNQILQVASETGADLIVIASHQPGLEDYLLGSVAGKVVRHAKCSVLVERQKLK